MKLSISCSSDEGIDDSEAEDDPQANENRLNRIEELSQLYKSFKEWQTENKHKITKEELSVAFANFRNLKEAGEEIDAD